MAPIVAQSDCIACHKDVKEGEIRGAISIEAPYEKYNLTAKSERFFIATGHFFVWLIGIIGIVIAQIYLANAYCKRQKAIATAEKLEFRNMLLKSLSEGVYGVGKDRKMLFINDSALKILGYTEEEVLGRCPHALFHYKYPDGREYPLHECPSDKSIRNGTCYSGRDMLFRKDGSGVPVEMNTVPIKQGDEIIGAVVAFRDISQTLKMQEELERVARTDYLTGIDNRGEFVKKLENSYQIFKRTGTNSSVLMLDIDFFKKINDTYGHAAGDKVLQEFSALLKTHSRAVDSLGRLGGEEFGMVLFGSSIDGAKEFAQRVCEKVRAVKVKAEDTSRQEVEISFTVSIGIARFETNDKTSQDVLIRADRALYRAKNSGRDRYEIDS